MKTKKAALVFNWTLTVMVIGILALALIQFNSKYNKYGLLGKKQLNLFKVYQEAESTLFFIDQSTKYALQQAVYELAQNGGIAEISFDEIFTQEIEDKTKKCEKFFGYNVWYDLQKEELGNNIKISCFDENKVDINLIHFLNKNLNQYLLNHPHNIPIDNYNYEIRDSLEIIGKAIAPLKFDILKDETKETIKGPIQTPEGLKDFTGTELCTKGTRCLLTPEAYEKLQRAQKRAKEKGISLEVYGSYRSREQLIQEWERGRFSYIKDEKIRRKYVCYPYGDDVENRCPHATGKVVDVRIKGKDDLILLKKIMTDDKLEDRWIRYAIENEEHHFECCGTARYVRAKELEEKTGQPVIEIV